MPFACAAATPLNATLSPTTTSTMNPRLLPIVIAVACAHGLVLWALQSGLVQHPAREAIAPVVIMVADLMEPARPEAAPAPQPPPLPPPKPQPEPVVPRPAAPQPTPQPKPIPAAEPAPTAPATPTVASNDPSPASTSQARTDTATTTALPTAPATPLAPSAPPPPGKVELPSSSARYLNNARPPYPVLSKRMGEQGRVVIRAFIDVNGTASQASVASSSGYERLDQTALRTVLQWRYVPGKRAGTPEAMWFNIPLDFVLD